MPDGKQIQEAVNTYFRPISVSDLSETAVSLGFALDLAKSVSDIFSWKGLAPQFR